ncbi:MAG: transposase [Anaerolineaceae bacterium]
MNLNRKSLRLQEYDYTAPGGYFITIVTSDRKQLFGNIENSGMHLNEMGEIAKEEWLRTEKLRRIVELFDEEFVVMPDHVHGIIWIHDSNVGAERRSALLEKSTRVEQRSTPTKKMDPPWALTNKPPLPGSLGVIVRAYKSSVAYRINQVRNTRGMAVWQRNYFEHVIRDEEDLEDICDYIKANPACWDVDDPFQALKTPNRLHRV